ncbi:hypothetical protein HHK36_023032 [Tetracentron sinense]|uniref:Uncharacterized protein n=1 Tax=Tetracentron sinense TaxID=13715 RepID=A0A835D6V7_TETSI|nr:hypothetical protein HHK36_023032 [Tetracentron sinense]
MARKIKLSFLHSTSPHYVSYVTLAMAKTALIGEYISPLDAFLTIGNVTYEIGCGGVLWKNESLTFPATQAANNPDATILFVGLDLLSVKAESLNRVHLLLPEYRTQLVNQLVVVVAKGLIILVIMSACGVDISFAESNPSIKVKHVGLRYLLLRVTLISKSSFGLNILVRKVVTALPTLLLENTSKCFISFLASPSEFPSRVPDSSLFHVDSFKEKSDDVLFTGIEIERPVVEVTGLALLPTLMGS